MREQADIKVVIDAALARQPDAERVFCVDGLGVGGAPCATCRGSTALSRGSR